MSNQDTEQYREFVRKLQRDENRPEALNDIKNLFVLKPPLEAVTTLRNVGISKILQCLNASDKSQVDLTCEVLKICFDKFNVGDVVKYYTGHIMYLLRHENDCVRRLVIDEICKSITTDPNLLPVSEFIDVFVAVAQLVADKDVTVANKAVMITSNLPAEAYPKVLDEMKIALDCGSVSKCNAFEVIVNVASKSPELFQICANLNYIDFMVNDLDTRDVLYQLNILEILVSLAIQPHGINYLVKHGGLKKIAEMVADLKNYPLGRLLIPGYMKFFGRIAHYYPKEIFEKYPVFIDLLFEGLESRDEAVLPVAMDTLGFIGTTVEGKLSLAAIGSKYTQAVENLGKLIQNSPSVIKVRALECFASLIGIEKDPNLPNSGPVDHRVTLMTREWFRSLSLKPGSTEKLLELCKNPFPDISLAAFELLDSVCQHQWGEELVSRVAGFVEYLLDRTVDHTKEAKEIKYEIIKRLSRSAAFDANIIMRLQTYVDQGPFYSEPTLEVAMEEGD